MKSEYLTPKAIWGLIFFAVLVAVNFYVRIGKSSFSLSALNPISYFSSTMPSEDISPTQAQQEPQSQPQPDDEVLAEVETLFVKIQKISQPLSFPPIQSYIPPSRNIFIWGEILEAQPMPALTIFKPEWKGYVEKNGKQSVFVRLGSSLYLLSERDQKSDAPFTVVSLSAKKGVLKDRFGQSIPVEPSKTDKRLDEIVEIIKGKKPHTEFPVQASETLSFLSFGGNTTPEQSEPSTTGWFPDPN